MPDMDAWMGDAFPLAGWTGADSSRDVARMIADRPTSIIVDRAGEALAVQTVRIEAPGQPRQAAGPAGVTVVAEALVIGYKGHPTIADTDLQVGDRFTVGGVAYEIVALVPGLTAGLQAYARVRS